MSDIIISEVCNRGVLSEGRSSGMGFALLKQVSNNTYETVNPISPCKDYLNEVVFTENTGYPTQGCGLKYPKVNNILKNKTSFLIFTNQNNLGGSFYVEGKSFQDYSKEILDGYKNIENLINNFQACIGLKEACKITPANNEQFLVEFDTGWANSTFSISLFTLLLRVGKKYQNNDFIEYLTEISKSKSACIDSGLLVSALPKIQTIVKEGKLPTIPKAHIESIKTNSYWSPHGYGILNWNGKYEEV